MEDLLSAAIDSTLPVGCSARNWDPECDDTVPYTKLVQRAELRWANRTQPLGHTVPLDDFLTSEPWTPSTVRIIVALLYRQGFALKELESWLKSEHAASRASEYLAIVIQAALDIYCCIPAEDSLDESAWIPHLTEISSLCFDHHVKPSLRRVSSSCVVLALDVFNSHRKDVVQLVTRHVDKHRNTRPTSESLRIGSQHPITELLAVLVEWSLHTLIGQLADDTFLSAGTLRLINDISTLFSH